MQVMEKASAAFIARTCPSSPPRCGERESMPYYYTFHHSRGRNASLRAHACVHVLEIDAGRQVGMCTFLEPPARSPSKVWSSCGGCGFNRYTSETQGRATVHGGRTHVSELLR